MHSSIFLALGLAAAAVAAPAVSEFTDGQPQAVTASTSSFVSLDSISSVLVSASTNLCGRESSPSHSITFHHFNLANSSPPQTNPFTSFLTETNSLGVVTGQPSVVTSQPAVVTSQPAAITTQPAAVTTQPAAATSVPAVVTSPAVPIVSPHISSGLTSLAGANATVTTATLSTTAVVLSTQSSAAAASATTSPAKGAGVMVRPAVGLGLVGAIFAALL